MLVTPQTPCSPPGNPHRCLRRGTPAPVILRMRGAARAVDEANAGPAKERRREQAPALQFEKPQMTFGGWRGVGGGAGVPRRELESGGGSRRGGRGVPKGAEVRGAPFVPQPGFPQGHRLKKRNGRENPPVYLCLKDLTDAVYFIRTDSRCRSSRSFSPYPHRMRSALFRPTYTFSSCRTRKALRLFQLRRIPCLSVRRPT